MSAVCLASGCAAAANVDHRALHTAPLEALLATPRSWPSYDRNMAEVSRREAAAA